MLSRIGKFTEQPEERGFENGKLSGELALCGALLSGEIIAYIELHTERPFSELDYEPYMTPEPEDS